MSEMPWGEMPYDGKNPRQVVDDYVLVRGDLVAEYAREQLANWIERYAEARLADANARLAAVWDEAVEATVEWVAATGRPGPNGPIDPPLNPYDATPRVAP